MSLTFTLHGVETKPTTTLSKSGRSEKLIKSTRSLVIKQARPDNPFFDRSNISSALKCRFNDVMVNKKGEEYPLDCNYGCDWCRRQFDTPPLGIPLTYRKKDNGVNAYTCDGYHCSFECVLASIRNEVSKSLRMRYPLYKDSEYILQNMFNKLYPGQKLKPQQDWRLLRDNGGDSTDEEVAKFTPYVKTPNVKLTPMSVVYQQC